MTAEAFNAAPPQQVQPKSSRLRRRTIEGGFWLLFSDVLSQSLGVIRAAILGRLLAPEDFGLFGIALLVQRWLEAFSDTGISAALLQRKGDVQPYLSTALWLQFGRASVVGAAVLLFAPSAGGFFHNAKAPSMIRCLALNTFLWAFTNPAVVCLRRELDFRRDVLWRLSNVLTSLAVTLVTCVILRNSWALVIGLLAGQAAQAATSYIAQPYTAGFRFHRSLARELLRFGRCITAANILGFLETQLDSLATGRLLGAGALGYYQVAAQFTAPAGKTGVLLYGLLFPALSRVESGTLRKDAFLLVLGPVAAVLLPAGFLFDIVAQSAVTAVLGQRWALSGTLACILIWAVIPRSIAACSTSLLLSTGKAGTLLRSQCFRIAMLVGLGYGLVFSYGVRGIAVAASLASILTLVQQLVAAARAVGIPLSSVLRVFRAPALTAAPAAAALAVSQWSARGGMALLICAALPCYAFSIWQIIRPMLPLARDSRGPNYVEPAPRPTEMP